MTDTLPPDKRSWNMSRIPSANTKPELIMRSLLHRAGFRFRISSRLPGSPDIVLPRHKTAIFVHGCFWHRHENCAKARMPNSNQEYWRKKFAANIARDAAVQQELERQQWQVLILWECEIMRDPLAVCAEVIKRLECGGQQSFKPELDRRQILELAEKKSDYYRNGGKQR
jgi:DNA mismatch endonuclease (patch repair protein)